MFLKKYANLRRFREYYARYAAQTALLAVCMLTASSMGVVLSYFMSEQLVAISNVALAEMIRVTGVILAVFLVHHAAWFLWDKLAAIIGNRIARDVRQDLLSAMLSTKLSALRPAGDYLQRMNDDVNEVSFFALNVYGTLADVLTNVTFLVILFCRNWQCSLLFTLGVAGLYAVDAARIRMELKYTEKIKALSDALDSRTAEAVRGAKDIKGLGVREEVLRESGAISRALSEEKAKMTRDSALLQRVRTYGERLIDAALVLMCALWLFPAGQITVVVLLLLFNYKGLMYDTITCFSRVRGYYVQGDFRAGRILEVLDGEKDRFGDEVVEDSEPSVEVRHLCFAYGEREVLRDVSFVLPPHSATVLLGASGSGKSTLFGLLTKVNEVGDGTVFLNGFDLNRICEESLRDHICVVNQEPFVFRDTIASNLRMVKPSAGEDELREACRRANLLDEILAMPEGFQTMLTENGGNLSGGQRQRLTIARAILKDAPVLLFDEPTSALDRENQRRFLSVIKELKREKTVFVIAHKLGDLSAFDQVLELENGRITRREK